jgi:hypothetical protein
VEQIPSLDLVNFISMVRESQLCQVELRNLSWALQVIRTILLRMLLKQFLWVSSSMQLSPPFDLLSFFLSLVPRNTNKQELNYLEKEDYGQIPEYLTHVKEEVRRENDMIERYIHEQMGTTSKEPEKYEELTEDEREQLLFDLKQKWSEVNSKYQRITHLVRLDTLGQIRRKEQMEGQLKQLEADIEKLSRAGPVLLH